MAESRISTSQKWLLGWTGVFILGAALLKQVQLSETTSVALGLVELLLAIATGVAFGLAVSRQNRH
jgi:hypothetical protein